MHQAIGAACSACDLVVPGSPRYLSADMYEQTDTIAAIATAPGEAGIAIVRMSGPDALRIADVVFKGTGDPPSRRADRTFVYGHIPAEDVGGGADVDADEVIMLIYHAPRSYTREDVVEIQGHGGRSCAGRILRRMLAAGARAAEPGEFTRRAFLNGRIDLLQAEAVVDLIRARSDRAAAAAIEQLEGRLSGSFINSYDLLLSAAGDLEATLDFPEDELPVAAMASITSRIKKAVRELEGLLETWEEGHILREGVLVVISGKPNVGKSTLLNRLLGKARAIVTDTPGTTRDTIEEQLIIQGVPVRLIDTAGIRESDCLIEQEGIERARASVRDADLSLHIIDASGPLEADERQEIDELVKGRGLIVLNKTDLGKLVTSSDFPGHRVIQSCLLRGEGLADIRKAILEGIGVASEAPPHPVISERHRRIVQHTLNELNACIEILEVGGESDAVPAATILRSALEQLGTATGRVYSDDLLDDIFSRFCVGK